MAKKKTRTVMRKVREVLRLHFESKLSNQQIADALRISKTSVFNNLCRFKESGIIWPVPEGMLDTELEAVVYRGKPTNEKEDILSKTCLSGRQARTEPDLAHIQEELTRPHMTLELLWNEYSQNNPEGLSRSSYYRHYQKYRMGLSISMKVIHKGGDKVFVDYSGDGLQYFNLKKAVEQYHKEQSL